jgi:hypothetical protein
MLKNDERASNCHVDLRETLSKAQAIPYHLQAEKKQNAKSAIHDGLKLSSSVSSPRHIDNSNAISTYRSCRQTRIEWFLTKAPKNI